MDEFSTLIADQKNQGLQTIEAWSPDNGAGDRLDLKKRRILSSFSMKDLESTFFSRERIAMFYFRLWVGSMILWQVN